MVSQRVETSGGKGIRFCSLVRAGLLALAISVVLIVTATPDARGWSASGTRCYGGSTIPFAQGAVYPFALPQVQFPGRTVSRSRCWTGTQKISSYWQILQWQGGVGTYTLYGSTASTVVVGRGKQAVFAPKAFEVLYPHHYTARLITIWRRYSGRFIARRQHDYIHSSDYRCYGTGGYCVIDALGGRANVFLDSGQF